MKKRKHIRWNTLQITAIGFLGIILLGGILLYLPVSNTRQIAFRRIIYIRYFRVRDRTGNGSSGVSVYDIRQGDTAYIDPDRRAWGDRMYDAVLFPASQADRA